MTAAEAQAFDGGNHGFGKVGDVPPGGAARRIVDRLEASLLHFLDVGAGRKERIAAVKDDAAHFGFRRRLAAFTGKFGNQGIAQGIALGPTVQRQQANMGVGRGRNDEFGCRVQGTGSGRRRIVDLPMLYIEIVFTESRPLHLRRCRRGGCSLT